MPLVILIRGSIVKVYIFDLLINLEISHSLIDFLVVRGVPYVHSFVLRVDLNFVLFKRLPDEADLSLFIL